MSTRRLPHADLALPNDLEAIAALPPPEQELSRAGRRQLFDTASTFLGLIANFVHFDADQVVAGRSIANNGASIQGAELWAYTFRALCSYYDFAVRRLIRDGLPKGEVLPPGIQLEPMKQFLKRPMPDSVTQYQAWAKAFAGNYLTCLQSCYFYETLQVSPLRGPLRVFEAAAHDATSDIARLLYHGDLSPLRDASERLLVSSLTYLGELYGPYELEKDHKYGAFSAILPDELTLLAKRDERMLGKYGHKQTETVFAERLALVAQSFGFYVVPALPGDRVVDLVCISSDSDDRFTALWEAKSTSRPYALPTDDERAIKEYVETARSKLKTLGPLRYVLIVSHRPAKSLNTKLVRLEAKIGLPTRFATAQSIANLREALPGPAPTAALAEAIITGGPVLAANFWEEAFDAAREAQRAHAEFVRSMLQLSRPTAAR